MTRELHPRLPVDLSAVTAETDIQVAFAADGAAGGLEVAAVALDGGGAIRAVVTPGSPVPAGAALSVLGAGAAGRFAVDLDRLDADISEVQFVLRDPRPDAEVVPGGHGGLSVTIEASGAGLAHFDAPATELPAGAAALALVIQRRGGWVLLPVGSVADDPVRAAERAAARATEAHAAESPDGGVQGAGSSAAPPPPPVDASPLPRHDHATRLRKAAFDEQMASEAPELLGTARTADRTLDEAGLGDHTARVALVLDMSYSMMRLYQSGRIQRFAEKVLAMATRLSPEGSVAVFQFGTVASFVGNLELRNHNGFVNLLLADYQLQKGTFYGKAMSAIRLHYFGDSGPRTQPWPATEPVYVMFLTDGETYDPDRTRQQAHWSAFEPVFWQFMAVGQSRESLGGRGPFSKVRSLFAPSFELLRELDDLEGRFLNNADFFSVTEPDALDDDALFEAMMHEYPAWVRAATRGRLLVPPGR